MDLPLTEQLKAVLATAFAFTLKAQYFHWNVTGPSFSEYHKFFEEVYSETQQSIGHYAEHIRSLGAYAPGSLNRMAQLTRVQDIDTIPSGLDMMMLLEADNKTLTRELYAAHQYAEALAQLGIMHFLQGQIDQHEKLAWRLKSFRGV